MLLVLVALWNKPLSSKSSISPISVPLAELPSYSILVPLYREANIAQGIVTALSQLQYPRDRLHIKLLLEEDDSITIDAVNRIALPPEFESIRVPATLPEPNPKHATMA